MTTLPLTRHSKRTFGTTSLSTRHSKHTFGTTWPLNRHSKHYFGTSVQKLAYLAVASRLIIHSPLKKQKAAGLTWKITDFHLV